MIADFTADHSIRETRNTDEEKELRTIKTPRNIY